MSHLIPIYAVWNDNAEAMASDIGELGVTVRQWRNRGNIPAKYWPRIIDAAAARGTELNLSQFLPSSEPQAA
ncbi:carph-isopro domain-containing protein [Novosphingobium sp. NPDC080210]|uniref:carph-isopro domain-containing protein n=1 Tax=Novosphingobium sp. NPDC080210 TaxID=3390596 RepID=UPI003D036A7D